jgi:hypothetical protein
MKLTHVARNNQAGKDVLKIRPVDLNAKILKIPSDNVEAKSGASGCPSL